MSKEFKEVISQLEENISRGRVSDKIANSLDDSIGIMKRDIERAQDKDSYFISHDKTIIIRNTLVSILNEVITGSTNNVINIVEDYVLLCYNWNRIAQNPHISALTDSIDTLLELQNNLTKLSDTFVDLYDEVEATKQFAPPSYGAKKEYLASLSDKFEEEV